jgi:hypothetical protein
LQEWWNCCHAWAYRYNSRPYDNGNPDGSPYVDPDTQAFTGDGDR